MKLWRNETKQVLVAQNLFNGSKTKMQHMFFRILTIGALLLSSFIIISVGIQTPIGVVIKSLIGHIPYGDKTLHLLLTTVLSFLFCASFKGRAFIIGNFKVLIGSVILALLITLEEFSQAFIPSRNFEFLDMVCNYAGIIVGSSLFLLFPTLSTAKIHGHHRKTISI